MQTDLIMANTAAQTPHKKENYVGFFLAGGSRKEHLKNGRLQVMLCERAHVTNIKYVLSQFGCKSGNIF